MGSKFDCILVLGYPNKTAQQYQMLSSRLKVAIRLYRKGIAGKIIVSGGGLRTRSGKTEGEEMMTYLVKHGIPKNAIKAECKSKNTIGNAFFSRPLIRKGSSIVIVTSEFHLPRSEYIFRKLYGNGYMMKFVASRTSGNILGKAKEYEKVSLKHVKSKLRGIDEKSSKAKVLKVLAEIKKQPKTPEMERKSWY